MAMEGSWRWKFVRLEADVAATAGISTLGAVAGYISSTSRSVLQPQQQIMTFSFVACSSSLSTES
jgi:hypothetical protein